jgi:DNA-binding transcriptional LysR family regulator
MKAPLPFELRHLRYFVAVAEELHFGHAAERLGISQPPLSEQIRALEAALGETLFERSRRRVTLTSSGRVLYAEATRLLAHAERVRDVMKSVRDGQAGQLFLGCAPTALIGVLPLILGAGGDGEPGLDVRVTEAHTNDIIAALLDGRLDAGLVWEERAPPPLLIRPLERIRFIVALHPRHPLASRGSVSLEALANEPLVMPPRDVTPHQFDRIHAAFRTAGLTPRIGQHARSISAQLGFVASGLGYALVASYATRLAMPGVAFVALEGPFESVPLSFVWDDRRAPSQIAAFLRRIDAVFPLPRAATARGGAIKAASRRSAAAPRKARAARRREA